MSPPWGTGGGVASGGSEPPPRIVMSVWFAGWPSSSSNAPRRCDRRGLGRWRSRRWAPPNSSSVDPGHPAARALLADYAETVAKPNGDASWPWPEPRLTYANAILPEAMIAAGVALDDSTLRQQGLDLLGWLVEYETAGGHLSPTPAGGQRAG